MKRSIKHILICLLLGVVTTVGVAWACAAFLEFQFSPFGYPAGHYQGHSSVMRYDRSGALRLISNWADEQDSFVRDPPERPAAEFIPAWAAADPAVQYRPSVDASVIDARGWPIRSMYASLDVTYDYDLDAPDRGDTIKTVRHGVVVGGDTPGSNVSVTVVVIPLRPIWSGFLADTALFAGAWFVLLFAPGLLRRQLRRNYGHCPSCGYNLHGDLATGCPECGWGRESEP